jgi:hypothetical protein
MKALLKRADWFGLSAFAFVVMALYAGGLTLAVATGVTAGMWLLGKCI